MEKLTIYAHGTCDQKRGGYGVIIISEAMREGKMTNLANEQFGCQNDTNIKTMELQAVVTALGGLNDSQIVIFTKSKYVLNGVKALSKPKKGNDQLWNALRGLVEKQKIEWKGTGMYGPSQQRVEQLARQGIASVIDNDEEEEEDAA